MNKSNKEEKTKVLKELGTTILFTIIVIILLIIFTFIKYTLPAGETIDAAIIFLAILPFIIYLVVSEKISEFRGGGFEFKFNKASNAEVYFGSEKVACEVFKFEGAVSTDEEVIVKDNLEKLSREILPEIAKKPKSTLAVTPGKGYYAYYVSKMYLEELTKFDFFKYVLFVDEDNIFKGYIHAPNLLVSQQISF